MQIEIASVDSVIIYFDNIISKEVSLKVKSAYKSLKKLENHALIEIIPSYNSIFITYNIFKYDFENIKIYLENKLSNVEILDSNNSKIVNIDVYYGKEVGIDLERVSRKTNLNLKDIIEIHSSRLYDVYAIGFLPGFAYLASLDERIVVPRLESPRKKVLKGSVAIADNQTAVYPQDSPGGWNIIGSTTFELFDKRLDNLSPISIDSKIKFNSITKNEFINQGGIL